MNKLTFNTSLCKGCALCVDACPKKLLRLSPGSLNEKGYHPVGVTDEDACISCAFCAVMCPDCVITVAKK
ncbi:MAG: 4Fe-4S binding protein [Oscillospiraceae bacterium]|jgi:2-oxoglutarate ferredoxin oxidoreductase subunit delta|nr:4Fe-4S binding protein [Oscillospiraceae bacterium]